MEGQSGKCLRKDVPTSKKMHSYSVNHDDFLMMFTKRGHPSSILVHFSPFHLLT